MIKRGRPSKQVKLENYCDICNKTIIGNSYKFKSHLFKHNVVQQRYDCEFCIKTFFRKDSYKAHINRHKGVPQRTYTCDYCDRAFVLKNNLITHIKRIHDENIDTELGKFRCNICDLSYCERRMLDQHVRRVHFNVQVIKEPLHTNKAINDTWIENVNNKNATVSITKVNNNVIVIKQLKFDVKVNETKPNVSYFNSECVDQYSKGICDYCKKEMLKKSLRTHIKEVHMNIRKFLCKVCKETFSRHYQLIEHKCGQFRRKPKKRIVIKKVDFKTESDSKLMVLKEEF